MLVGYSGHGVVVAEAADLFGIQLIGYTEKREAVENPYSLTYHGFEADPDFTGWSEVKHYILGIGDNNIRVKAARLIEEKGGQCVSIIHPAASVSKLSKIGEGTFVARNAAVNPMCEIGKYVILNTSCGIDHDCVIRAGAHIAPGAVLAGNVKVGEGAFLGANSVVKEGVSIGEKAVIGAGSVIVHDVKPNSLVVGNPGKVIK